MATRRRSTRVAGLGWNVLGAITTATVLVLTTASGAGAGTTSGPRPAEPSTNQAQPDPSLTQGRVPVGGPHPGAAEPSVGRAKFDPSFTHGRVPVDGGVLHYVRGGSGPALVLLHGWPQTWWEWRKVMPALARTHTVIAFDLPGLGGSTVPPGGFDAATTSRRIRQAVHRLGFRQVKILAHDDGALVAYPYARDFPSEVSRLAVLELPLNGFGLEDAYRLSWHFRFNSAPKPLPERIVSTQDDVEAYLGSLFDGAHRPAAIDRREYFRAYADPATRSAAYEYYRAFAANAADNQANASKRLAMPVLAMGAQHVFGAQIAESFRHVADDVREVVAPASGHWIPEENPAFLTDCARLFFGPPTTTPSSPALAPCAP
ncbi:alpha/beta fold hydrolase [Sphaerisporangium siamense]|uniref:Pimeloyl-ACP methyl ester carboxylesterase n=1 Tax=Sphaerisporangium siamense TaxID=795645 RepID=A0A7W7D270_9ACTN|nr:alpha/beta fold hydrolase [Sphaerisporangium siamense]MBB4698847.1 pimeloyl-ACP methyl ester carboxylesterase [Sphaerisporangium siamense]